MSPRQVVRSSRSAAPTPRLFVKRRSATGTWPATWERVGLVLTGAPTVVAHGTNGIQVVASGAARQVYSWTSTTAGSWSPARASSGDARSPERRSGRPARRMAPFMSSRTAPTAVRGTSPGSPRAGPRSGPARWFAGRGRRSGHAGRDRRHAGRLGKHDRTGVHHGDHVGPGRHVHARLRQRRRCVARSGRPVPCGAHDTARAPSRWSRLRAHLQRRVVRRQADLLRASSARAVRIRGYLGGFLAARPPGSGR